MSDDSFTHHAVSHRLENSCGTTLEVPQKQLLSSGTEYRGPKDEVGLEEDKHKMFCSIDMGRRVDLVLSMLFT